MITGRIDQTYIDQTTKIMKRIPSAKNPNKMMYPIRSQTGKINQGEMFQRAYSLFKKKNMDIFESNYKYEDDYGFWKKESTHFSSKISDFEDEQIKSAAATVTMEGFSISEMKGWKKDIERIKSEGKPLSITDEVHEAIIESFDGIYPWTDQGLKSWFSNGNDWDIYARFNGAEKETIIGPNGAFKTFEHFDEFQTWAMNNNITEIKHTGSKYRRSIKRASDIQKFF